MMRPLVAAWFLVGSMVSCTGRAEPPPLREGDIIFQTSRSAQSLAIQRATGSRYSHMGLILFRGGRPYVLEAAGTVHPTPLDAWIRRGQDGHFVVKRLKAAPAALTPHGLHDLRRTARMFEGKPYDSAFEWSDDRMYCSELVWKVYQRALGIQLGALQRLRSFDLGDPTVQRKLRERYGRSVPLDQPVIAPVAMFDSPLLETVVRSGR